MKNILFFLTGIFFLLLSVGEGAAEKNSHEPGLTPSDRKNFSHQQEAQQLACAKKISMISARDAELDRLRRLFRKNLHLRGTVHNMIPHWDANYSDFQIVQSFLTESDIPYVVYLLARTDMSSGMRSIAVGVLIIFAERAIPCINAALNTRIIHGFSELQGGKASIEAAARGKQVK